MFKSTKILNLAICLGLVLSTYNVQAQNFFGAKSEESIQLETKRISSGFNVRRNATETVSFGQAKYIKNLVVKAYGVGADSTVQVYVNGEIKGTIYAPRQDPTYVVTVAETANSIQFVYDNGGEMKIESVDATTSVWSSTRPERPVVSLNWDRNGSEFQFLAASTLRILDQIKSKVTLEEEKVYFMPIKKMASQVLVKSRGRGDESVKTSAAVKNLQNQIDFAGCYFNTLLEREDLYHLLTDLNTIAERIDDLLD